MSSTKSYSEIKDRSGNGLSPESYGSEYRNQISILNSNFLSSIQKALKKSPDACLAPLVMDYLQFLYPIVTSPQDTTLTGKLYSNDSIDFGTVAKFFQDLKSNMTSSSGSSSAAGFGNSLRSGTGTNESSSVEKASVSSKPFFSLPSPTVVAAQRSSETSTSTSSSLFGQPPNPVLHFNAPVSTPSSNLKPRLEFDSKTTSIFPNSVSSTLTNNTFGSSKMSTGTTTSSSASMSSTSTSTVQSAFTSSSFQKSELSSIPSSSGTAKLTSFSFGSLSSSSTDPTLTTTNTTFGSNGFQNSGSSSAAFSKSLFGAPSGSGSGFGQTSFGASIAADAARLSGPNGGTEATKEDSDDDSPPKPDHVPVVEKDSVYSQRVKLFEMEGKGFKDLGIGNLFIKQIDGGKHQLVVRADNSLGIILINVVLNASMPIRQNKPTNVLATIPNSEGKPVTYLLRVKEESVGNELFKNLEKYKNK